MEQEEVAALSDNLPFGSFVDECLLSIVVAKPPGAIARAASSPTLIPRAYMAVAVVRYHVCNVASFFVLDSFPKILGSREKAFTYRAIAAEAVKKRRKAHGVSFAASETCCFSASSCSTCSSFIARIPLRLSRQYSSRSFSASVSTSSVCSIVSIMQESSSGLREKPCRVNIL